MMTGSVPKRSASAPENGCIAPYNKVCIATASAKTSRSQPLSIDIGRKKTPSDERGPKLMVAMMQPEATISAAVRQSEVRVAARSSAGAGLCIGAVCRSGCCRSKPRHWLLDNRQVDQAGHHPEQDRKPP